MTDHAFVCSICRQPRIEFGNNAWPINMGRCCDRCNWASVIPARIERLEREQARAVLAGKERE